MHSRIPCRVTKTYIADNIEGPINFNEEFTGELIFEDMEDISKYVQGGVPAKNLAVKKKAQCSIGKWECIIV